MLAWPYKRSRLMACRRPRLFRGSGSWARRSRRYWLWAAAIVEAQQGREVPSDSVSQDALRCVEAIDIAPAPVLAQYRCYGTIPKSYLHVDASGRVAGVVLCWANFRLGLVIVPRGQAPALEGTFYERQPTPDIRVFCVEF